MISHTRIIQWMNVIREETGSLQYRILENFWESQLTSKMWLIDNVDLYCHLSEDSDIYVFGGWYGILAQLLCERFPNVHVYSIDKDPRCMEYGKKLMLPNDNITFVTNDMKDFVEYSPKTALVINTSTEHITQEIYDSWLLNVPVESPIVLQGNDFFDCEEHIRCTKSIDEFNTINKLSRHIMSGSLQCNPFTRWMTIGYKE